MGSSESTERSMQKGKARRRLNRIEANKKDQIPKVAVAGAVAGVLVAWGISSLLSGTEPEKNKKMTKAPGRYGYIDRDDFQREAISKAFANRIITTLEDYGFLGNEFVAMWFSV